MKKIVLSAAFAALLPLAMSAQAQQKLVPGQSEIVFVSKQMGVPVEGRFEKFDAQITFDPKKPETSKMAFTIDLSSARLGSPETEAELVKPGWFNSQKVPQASFVSTAIQPAGAGKFTVSGKLTIKGVTKDVAVPATLTQSGDKTTASGEFLLKRIDFKIGEGEWNDTSIVANDVQVRYKLSLSGVGKL